MSDETIQYITTDYLIEVDGGDPTPTPIEYIVELGQVGVQGIPGEKGEPGFSPTVSYILNDDTFKINIVNQDGVTQTPNLYDYFADKNGYLQVDGSNASNNITINQARFTSLSNNSGVRIQNTNGRGALQLSPDTTYLQTGSYGMLASYSNNLVSFGNVNGTAKVIQATADKVYYEAYSSSPSDSDKEIATIGDISDATITITQGGVTKGTFTTNQSGNTTINLDAGGGSITNPLEIIGEPYGDYGTQQKITIKAGTGDGNLNDIELGFKPTSSGGWITTSAYLISQINNPLSISNATGLGRILSLDYDSNTLDLNDSNALTVKGMVGADGVNAGSTGLVPAPTATDNTKFLRGDGTWQTVGGGGGGSYTAGTGIDITNDVISIDTSVVAQLSDIPDVSNFVTTSDLSTTLASYVQSSSLGSAAYTDSTDYATAAQGNKADTAIQPADLATVATTGSYTDLLNKPTIPTNSDYVDLTTNQIIGGVKTFSSETHHTGVITFDSSMLNPIIRGMSGLHYRNMIYRMGNNSAIIVGNSNDTIDLKGSDTRPTYNSNNLALYSDIPTVPTNISSFNNDSGYITSAALSGYATETWVGQQGYITGITSTDVTNALGYTPYNATNPNGFISGIDSTMVVTALGYTPYNSSNPNGYTSNVGTVTSVNNVQPDSNGNVTISIPSTSNLANTNLSNLTATGKSKIATLSMPSDSPNKIVIASSTTTPALSLPTTATDYIAKSNGYAYLYMQFTSGYAQLNNVTANISTILNASSFGDFSCIPVQKGQTYRYNPGNATGIGYWLFYFILAEGDV